MTFRFAPEAAERIKAFLSDYAGKPLKLKPGTFAEKALLREIERLELILAGALPADPPAGHANRPIADLSAGRRLVIDHASTPATGNPVAQDCPQR